MDVRNSRYWDEISSIFKTTMQLMQHFAEKEGIDLDSFDKEELEAESRKREHEHEKAMNHPISVTAKNYMEMVNAFFKNERELFEQKGKEMDNQFRLGINESKIKREVDSIQDAFEIINWYSTQVEVKMIRAFTSRVDEEEEEWEDENGFQRDSDGSAKVALMGIDRSIYAWGKLQRLFPDETDNLITFLLHLDRLRKKIEEEFPEARNFKRPGFDD